MTRYRKIETAMWCDRRFRALTAPPPNARDLWIYLLCGPRTTIFPGVVVATEAVIADDLRWSVSGLRGAWAEIESHGMAVADWEAGVILLPKALQDGAGLPRESAKPGSPNQLRHWARTWVEVPECDLKCGYLDQLQRFAESLDANRSDDEKPYTNAFLNSFETSLRRVRDSSPTSRGTRPRPARDPDPDLSPVLGGGVSGFWSPDLGVPEPPDPHGDRSDDLVHDRTHSRPTVTQGTITGSHGNGEHIAEVEPSHAPVPTAVPVPYTGSFAQERSEPDPGNPAGKSGNALLGQTRGLSVQASDAAPDPEVMARRALVHGFPARVNALRVAVAAARKVSPGRPVSLMGRGEVELMARLRESVDPAGDLEHVLEIAAAEARTPRGQLRWLSWSLAEPKSWALLLATTAADVADRAERERLQAERDERRKPRDVFAEIDAAFERQFPGESGNVDGCQTGDVVSAK